MVLKSSVLSLRKVKVGVKSNFVSTAKGAKTIVEEKMAHTFHTELHSCLPVYQKPQSTLASCWKGALCLRPSTLPSHRQALHSISRRSSQRSANLKHTTEDEAGS